LLEKQDDTKKTSNHRKQHAKELIAQHKVDTQGYNEVLTKKPLPFLHLK